MKILGMNKRMREFYSPDWDLSAVRLPDELQKILDYGVVIREGCFLIGSPGNRRRRPPLEQYADRAYLESIANEIFLKYITKTDQLLFAFAYMHRTSEVLRREFPDQTFHGIISTDLNGDNCTTTFYCRRPEEARMLRPDLEEYEGEAVCLLDLSQ
jgi:hypothetical protein